jgi:amidase
VPIPGVRAIGSQHHDGNRNLLGDFCIRVSCGLRLRPHAPALPTLAPRSWADQGQRWLVSFNSKGGPVSEELWRLGATELAGLLTTRELASREVVEALLARIEVINPSVNAVTVTLADAALAAAGEADRAMMDGATIGPLHGVPFTVKENIDLTGSATTQGLVAMKQAIPDLDAPVVAQFKQAGAIPLARTNLPDFGLRWHTANALRGVTKNPWDASRTPGGSSGGEAAALATGMSCLGLGNDYGGSLRVPAQFCGVSSIRPTLGRVPTATAFKPDSRPISGQLMSVQGPMARRVADVRLALQAMCGPDPRDPWWTPAPLDGPALPRRVAVWRAGDDAQVEGGLEAAAAALADAGYDVDEREPPLIRDGAQLWAKLVFSDVRLTWSAFGPMFGPEATTFLELAFAAYPDCDKDAYVQGLIDRQHIARTWSLFQSERPLVLAPVSTRRPFLVDRDIENEESQLEVLDSMRLTVVVNLLGLPAAAVPVGEGEGLPQGVQVIGPRYREDLCLDAAQAIEDRLGGLAPIQPR